MDLKKEFFKYFQYWPWFAVSLILSVSAAFFYIKTVLPVYQSTALINIDRKEEAKTKIITISTDQNDKEDDLEDEIMLITSNAFLLKVVNSLQLNIDYFEKGYLLDVNVEEVPFVIKPLLSNDLLPMISYDIRIDKHGFTISDPNTKKTFSIRSHKGVQIIAGLPFTIQLTKAVEGHLDAYLDKEYTINLESTESALTKLKSSLSVSPDEKSKGTLVLYHNGTNPVLSRKILEKLIVLLDENIIINKQKLFTNTVKFLNQRIENFSKEKDSIEIVKEQYLQNNNIFVLEKYINNTTNDITVKKASSLLNEKQIFLTKFAIKDVRKTPSTSSLGTDYNLDEPTVNQLLSRYNTTFLESKLLLQRAQKNNPVYQSTVEQLKVQKEAILKTLENYLDFLNQANVTNRAEQYTADNEAKSIPTKDKILGNINNDLSMKEEIYMILLQKREEAILNGAVLESNLKTLNSPQTNYSPIFPQTKPFMLGAFLFGLLLPFGLVYLYLQFDTNLYTEEDILGQIGEFSFLGTLPQVDTSEKFTNTASSRSLLAESTRSLFSNITYLLPQKEEGKGYTLLFTSSVKGEGKTFSAFNNAITISNLNKKVLLIGADLRNPQLHDYVNEDKNISGLSNFLSDKSLDWKLFLKKDTDYSENLHILFSGAIPPNPAQLLTNANFDLLVKEAKTLYDFIIIDSAPIQMVSDTLNFSYLADVTVFITRSNYTDKKILIPVKDFIDKGKLKNVGIVINGISSNNASRYNYAYNYTYNYGYNYGMEEVTKPWYKK